MGGSAEAGGVFLMRYPLADGWGEGVGAVIVIRTAILPRPCSGPCGDEEDRFQARVRV